MVNPIMGSWYQIPSHERHDGAMYAMDKFQTKHVAAKTTTTMTGLRARAVQRTASSGTLEQPSAMSITSVRRPGAPRQLAKSVEADSANEARAKFHRVRWPMRPNA